MGQVEELEEDQDLCASCKKPSVSKCTNCRDVFYCSKECQKRHWKEHKFSCKSLPYKIGQSKVLGKFLEASRDVKKGDVLFNEPPLVVGPVAVSNPICLNCYRAVDGKFLCRKSGWPLCGPDCEKAVEHNAEVVVPHQTEGRFQIEEYNAPCYLYECVAVMRVLLMQKSAPKKYKKIKNFESHLKTRRGTAEHKKAQETVVDVMKKTLGIMVFEVLYPMFDFSDDNIHELVGIFETNGIEIRLSQSEINGLYETGCLMEHNCVPNVNLTFDKHYNLTAKAGRDIAKGEHLSIMYTHSLWGSHARRGHLYDAKKFWCMCQRCKDPTEFGTDFSTILRDGKLLRPKAPLDQEAPWVSSDGSIVVPSYQVVSEMQEIGSELALLQLKGTIDDYEEFIGKYGKELHPNHYHMLTAKHSLMQMLGRTDGCLIQDMPLEKLQKKEDMCREVIELCEKLDPARVRLQIYIGAALYELHLPLLQYGKRKWETGEIPTEDFRKTLYEPRDIMNRALEMLQDETNEQLSEGQLRMQIKDTKTQLEQFMKTLGCDL